jgi:hypothetical protein
MIESGLGLAAALVALVLRARRERRYVREGRYRR